MPKKNAGYRKEWREERGVFEIVWFERGQRRRRSTGTDNGKQADQFLKGFIEEQEKRIDARLVEDILADYLEEHGPHVARPDDIAYSVKALLPFFTGLDAAQINKAKCQEFSLWRKNIALAGGKTLSNATIRRNLAHLQAACHHDRQAERLEKVPVFWLPQAPPPRERWLTRKEAAGLLRAARNLDGRARHLPWFILLSLYSGQRMRAVLNLTWDRVDLERGLINWQYGRATNKRRPRQPMPDELKMFLRFLHKYATHGYVLHKNGRQVLSVKNGFKASVDAAKIVHASPHTLKHTAITWMLQNGTDPWSVSGFTGTSVHTITKVYGHHAPDYMEEARNSMKKARQARAFVRVTAPDTAPAANQDILSHYKNTG